MKDKNTNKNATKEVDLNEKATNTLDGNEELKTSCESCKKSFHPMTLLKHIGQSKDCKVFYGPRFKEMKKRQERERKQRYRNNTVLKVFYLSNGLSFLHNLCRIIYIHSVFSSL